MRPGNGQSTAKFRKHLPILLEGPIALALTGLRTAFQFSLLNGTSSAEPLIIRRARASRYVDHETDTNMDNRRECERCRTCALLSKRQSIADVKSIAAESKCRQGRNTGNSSPSVASYFADRPISTVNARAGSATAVCRVETWITVGMDNWWRHSRDSGAEQTPSFAAGKEEDSGRRVRSNARTPFVASRMGYSAYPRRTIQQGDDERTRRIMEIADKCGGTREIEGPGSPDQFQISSSVDRGMVSHVGEPPDSWLSLKGRK
ncbi:hypothetical protein BU26DRAFT_510287 [Trematosphaeria pertusa]|uniref:Uncharacterized protein n=1 Tax=Trematosphaeria pertusa TaxID=390896 RepID=A0A6A6HY00_9PLEO|nr:uncharacterized protein BU26DRAFT_510287 [Trematosphaeria pertusa]KAF2243095.1 hypothetical protein BU26DRAFT_510287 [Trematosphaeria pertusa]